MAGYKSDLLWLLKAKFLLLSKYLANSVLEALFFKTRLIYYFLSFKTCICIPEKDHGSLPFKH